MAALLTLSLLWRSPAFSLGVLCGGLIIIFGFQRLRRQLQALALEPTSRTARQAALGFPFRLAIMAALIAAVLISGQVDPLGLLAGLSVVVINLFWTTWLRLRHKE